ESICRVIQIAPSGYYQYAARARQPELRSARAKQDELLSDEVQRVWDDNMQCYGVVKVWKQLKREGIHVARCTVQRLMRRLGLQGVRRGHVIRTTMPDEKAVCPLDKVQRHFHAGRPNQLWVSD
ncbi:IS3 family transposase, partial [Pseudomonas saliphila]